MRRFVLYLAILTSVSLAPAILHANDQQIAESVKERLKLQQEAGALRDFQFDLSVNNGQVWITGRVASAQQQRLVLEVARRVRGVTQVVNDLSVETAQAAVQPIDAGEGEESSGDFDRYRRYESLQAPMLVEEAPAAIPQASQGGSLLSKLGFDMPKGNRRPSRAPRLVAQGETQQQRHGLLSSLRGMMANRDGGVRQASSNQPMPVRQASVGSGVAAAPPVPIPTDSGYGGQPGYDYGYEPQPAYAPQGYGPQPGYGPAYGPQGNAGMPLAFAPAQVADARAAAMQMGAAGGPQPSYVPSNGGITPATYDHPYMPNYSWPSYASYPNYSALTYPKQYSPTAWPYIGPFYPYPQVPMGWRKVTLEWDDGWWFLDFNDGSRRRRFR